MDITFDGVPALLVDIEVPAGAGPFSMALTWDFPLETVGGLEADASGLPWGFFQNDYTGEIVHSSRFFNHGAKSIVYRCSEGFAAFRAVTAATLTVTFWKN